MWQKIKEGAAFLFNDVTGHWKKPAAGNYVSYKEILCLGVGSMGQQFFTIVMAYFSLSVSSTLMGATLGLQPMHMQMIGMFTAGFGMIIAVFRNYIMDRTHTRYGKFRPWVAVAGFPVLAMAIAFVFLDFDKMTYFQTLTYATIFSFAISVFQPLFVDPANNIPQVITPNSMERAKIFSINAFIYSIAPSLFYLVGPMLIGLTGGYNDIASYRWVIVPFAVLGVFLSLFAAFGTKERIVASKNYTPKVNTWRSVAEIFKNKYWVITQVSTLIGFLEGAIASLKLWVFMYDTQDYVLMGILNTVLGSAATLSYLISPILMRRLGVRNTFLLKEFMNVVLICLMYLTYKNVILLFFVWYFNQIFASFVLTVNPVIGSDLKDYQQYKSGKRLDTTFGTAQLVTQPIAIASGFVLSFIYESFGLTKNYNILYDPFVRNEIFGVLCLLAILGAALNFLPLMFYDLNRSKHGNIIKVLSIRALFEDWISGDLSPQVIVAGVDQVNEARSLYESAPANVSACKRELRVAYAARLSRRYGAEKRKRIGAAEALPANSKFSGKERRDGVKGAKAALRTAKAHREAKKESVIVIDEMRKFDTLAYRMKVAFARAVAGDGIGGFVRLTEDKMKQAVAGFAPDTKKDVRVQNALEKKTRKLAKSAAAVRKKHCDFAAPDPAKLANAAALAENSSEERQQKKRALRAATAEIKRYHRIAYEFLEAERMLKLEKAYRNYHEIERRYDQAARDCAAAAEDGRRKEQERLAIKEAEIERIRRERSARKALKKARAKSKRVKKGEA